MPYLTDTALPADMADFLDPADAVMLRKLSAFNAHLEERKANLKTRKKASAKVKNKKQSKNVKEDLGVPVERGMKTPDYTSTKASNARGKNIFIYQILFEKKKSFSIQLLQKSLCRCRF